MEKRQQKRKMGTTKSLDEFNTAVNNHITTCRGDFVEITFLSGWGTARHFSPAYKALYHRVRWGLNFVPWQSVDVILCQYVAHNDKANWHIHRHMENVPVYKKTFGPTTVVERPSGPNVRYDMLNHDLVERPTPSVPYYLTWRGKLWRLQIARSLHYLQEKEKKRK